MANASVRTVQDIFDRVQRTFGDEANIQVTADDVIRWVNDACSEVVMQHENLLMTEGFLDSEVGLQTYELPENCYIVSEVYYRNNENSSDPYTALQFISNQELSALGIDWNQDPADYGLPQYYTRGIDNNLILFPATQLELSNSIRISYARYSVAVEAIDDDIDLPAYYHSYVEHFCMMKAYEKDEDWGAVDRKAQLVQSTIDFNNAKEQWFGQQTYPVISGEYD